MASVSFVVDGAPKENVGVAEASEAVLVDGAPNVKLGVDESDFVVAGAPNLKDEAASLVSVVDSGFAEEAGAPKVKDVVVDPPDGVPNLKPPPPDDIAPGMILKPDDGAEDDVGA